MKKLVCIVAVVFCLNVMAQSAISNNGRLDNVGINDFGNGMWLKSSGQKTDIKGSPYLYDSWVNSGKIFLSDKVISIKSFNYNMKSERFEAKISKDSVFAVDPQGVKKIEILGNVFIRTLDPEFQRNSYFQKIASINGKLLLEKHIVELKEGQINPMTMQKMEKDALIKKEIFYLANDKGEKLKKFKLRKRSILSLLDKSKASSVKDFVKQNRLKFTDPKDVKALLEYSKSI